MRRFLMPTLVVVSMTWPAHRGAADEVAQLAARLDPPRRFENHRARWSTSKEQVVFQGRGGPETWTFWFIRDGEGVVAVMPTSGFHGGTLYVQSFEPGKAPKKVPFPKERWHIDTAVGTELRTNNFIPDPYGTTDESYRWSVEGERLILTRRFQGRTAFNRWAHNTRGKEVAVDATNTIEFRVDPQLGYVVDAVYDIWTDQPPASYEYSSAATSGRYLLWPGLASCYRHAITPAGSTDIIGYATNHGCTKQHGSDMTCREGGFVSFLNDRTGWSPTLSLSRGGDAKLIVCGAHTDLDFVLKWPSPAKTREDGLKHNGAVRLRLLGLPPELTRHVWDNMKLLHENERTLMIRLGVPEDFEDQPLALSGRERGMPWNAEVTEKFARSGKKSITFSGRSGHGDPQVNLMPGVKYVCEAWVKVVDFTAEERAAADARQQEAIEKAKAAAQAAIAKGKKPPTIPAFEPAGEAQAWIGGWTYEWSPHTEKPIDTFKSNVVGPAEQWQRVAFEFTAADWGPFIQLEFIARNCTVYLDDFRIGPIQDAAGR